VSVPVDGNMYIPGSGEMSDLTREKNWSETPLGPADKWPQSLVTTLGVALNSKFPMLLLWGPELICFYNDAFRPSLGQDGKHPSILGMPAEKAWAEVWHIIKPLFDQVLSGGEATWSEDQLVPIFRNGKIEEVYWTFSYSAVHDESRKIAGILVTCSETTGKIILVRELEESNRRFLNNIMQAPVAMCVFRGPNHVVEIANPYMLELWGKDAADVINRPIFEGLPEIRDQGLEELIDKVYRTGEKFEAFEHPVGLPRNGRIETIYVNFIYEPIREPDGRISGIVAIASDVTAGVSARKKAEASEQDLKSMVLESPVGICIIDAGTLVIELVNQSFITVAGKPFEAIINQHYWDAFAEARPYYERALEGVIKNGVPYHAEEVKLMLVRHGNEENIFVTFVYAPLNDHEGKVRKVAIWVIENTTQVKAREKIRDSDDRLRELNERLVIATEGTQMGIWDLNIATKELFHSPRFAQIFGYPETTKLTTHSQIRAHVHPEDLQVIVEKAFAEALQTGNYFYEARVFHLDKSVRWIRIRGKILFDENQVPERMLGTIIDITDARHAEQMRARIAAIVESSDDAIISKTFEGIVTSWNKAAERIFGYTPEEMIGQSITKLIPADRLDEEPRIIEGLKQGRRFDHFETKRITKDKKILDISLTISPVRDSTGNLIGAAKIARDITEQKKIEKLVKASEEKFRLLADSMPQFVWTGDHRGNLNYFNKTVYAYSGLTQAQVEAGGWIQIVHPEDRQENIDRWQHAVLTGEDFLFEHRFRRHDGVYRWQLSRAIAQKDDKGQIQMWVGTSTDIDDIKKHEQQKDDFIRMASHELKTPVTTIKGYIQLLVGMQKDQQETLHSTALVKVDKQVNKLTKLINDLLDLTRIETGRLQLEQRRYPISVIIQEVISDISMMTGKHRIDVLLSDDFMVFVDKDRIEQVLINLITNAIKYSPKAEMVILKVYGQDGQVVISLTDFGIGIPAGDAEKIFERFYRVEGKDEKTFPGFGIGLFIVREIVELHGGKVWVNSELNKGSTFYVSLPVFENDAR
jgi:PAS domain S-box-containing protein